MLGEILVESGEQLSVEGKNKNSWPHSRVWYKRQDKENYHKKCIYLIKNINDTTVERVFIFY